MNNGDLPVPHGYSLPRYLAPSPPVTTVLLPTSMFRALDNCQDNLDRDRGGGNVADGDDED